MQMNRFSAGFLVLLTCLLILPACALLNLPPALPPTVASYPKASQAASLPTQTLIQTAFIALPSPTPFDPPVQAPTITSAPINGQIALGHIVALSERIGPRVAGEAGETKAAKYIETILKKQGYEVYLQPFAFTDEDEELALYSSNIIAVKPGSSTREIIVGAHYDSVEVGRGADDNASGVAVMLEVAEKIKDQQLPFTIRFIAFGAEEVGLVGSSYFVNKMSAAEIQNTIGMINLDSLTAGDIAYVYGDTKPKGALRDWILEYVRTQGYDLHTQPVENLDELDGTPCDCADYGPFQAAGIPFAYFEATNWNVGEKDGWTQVDPKYGKRGKIWHTEYDCLEYLDQTFPGRVERHLNMFVSLLYATLTQFYLPN